MFGRVIGFVLCLIGLLLPFRLRIIFTEIFGWFVQFFYLAFYSTLNFILKELKESESAAKEEQNEK